MVLVHDLEQDGVAAPGDPGLGALHRPRGVDALELTPPVLRRDDLPGRQMVEVGVSVPRHDVGVGELLGLDEVVQVLGRVVPHGAEVDVAEDLDHLERGDPLAVGGQLVQPVVLVVGADRLDPRRGMVLEVLHRQEAVVLVGVCDDRLGDRPLVEGVAAVVGDQPEGAGHVRVAEHLPGPGRALAVEE